MLSCVTKSSNWTHIYRLIMWVFFFGHQFISTHLFIMPLSLIKISCIFCFIQHRFIFFCFQKHKHITMMFWISFCWSTCMCARRVCVYVCFCVQLSHLQCTIAFLMSADYILCTIQYPKPHHLKLLLHIHFMRSIRMDVGVCLCVLYIYSFEISIWFLFAIAH